MCCILWVRIAQSVQRIATGWTVRGSNPGCGEMFRTRPDRPSGPPSLAYNVYRVSFPWVKRPDRDINHSPPSSAEVKEIVELYIYSLDGLGIESWWGRDFPHLSRPALGPIQPRIQWVPGVKSGRGVTLTPNPLLVPWSRKSRAILLLPPIWAVRPVQNLSACTRMHFTLYLYSPSGSSWRVLV